MKKSSGRESANGTAYTEPAQDRFLKQMIKEHTRVAVFLQSGVRLEGEIVSYDQFVILMKGAMTDKVYKHAVSTVQPISSGGAKGYGDREATSRAPTIKRRTRPRVVKIPGDES